MKRPIHKDFITFAEENGINLDDTDDYESWYDCWCHGYNIALAANDSAKKEKVNKEED